MPLIEITGLYIKYVRRKAPTLSNVDLVFNEGETVLLLGASGSGKSTLALTLNGLIPHALGVRMQGLVSVDGLDTQQHGVADLAQRVGIVFQDPEAQFVTLKVEDEIAFGLENLRIPPEEMDARIDRALADVDMLHTRLRRVDQLSGGEKQRVVLAALLAMEPSVLVFDEPTANLDPVGTRDVFDLIRQHKARHQHTIILIEHKLDDLIDLIDRVIVLGDVGAIIADGEPRAVFRDQAAVLHVARLANRLHNGGVTLDPFPLTLDDAEAVLRDKQGRYSGGMEETRDKETDQISSPASIHSHAPSDPPAINIRQLSFGYDRRRVLDQISLQVPSGDFLAIVGANGAGKTTLAQHLVTILRPPRGVVRINGQDVTQIGSRQLTRQIGYVFQNPEHQFITDSVAEEISYGLRVMGLADDEVASRSEAMLQRFGLARYAKANPFTLSHGEKRRLSVATMLAMGQQILILDEPTFGQDQRNAEALLDLLRDLHAEGRTIVIVTHDMALVAKYVQHVAVLAGGRLLFHGDVPALFAQPDLLAQARLTPPPLAQLAHRLAHYDSRWRGLLTLDQFIAAIPKEKFEVSGS
jgi:energy-coupling factor transport system ATP-binding protein